MSWGTEKTPGVQKWWETKAIISYSLQCTVLIKRVQYFVLLNYSFKSWSIIKTRDSFRISLSWGFQNTHWKLNLMKIWLSKSRSKAFYPFLNNVCYWISYEWNHRENMIFYAKNDFSWLSLKKNLNERLQRHWTQLSTSLFSATLQSDQIDSS